MLGTAVLAQDDELPVRLQEGFEYDNYEMVQYRSTLTSAEEIRLGGYLDFGFAANDGTVGLRYGSSPRLIGYAAINVATHVAAHVSSGIKQAELKETVPPSKDKIGDLTQIPLEIGLTWYSSDTLLGYIRDPREIKIRAFGRLSAGLHFYTYSSSTPAFDLSFLPSLGGEGRVGLDFVLPGGLSFGGSLGYYWSSPKFEVTDPSGVTITFTDGNNNRLSPRLNTGTYFIGLHAELRF